MHGDSTMKKQKYELTRKDIWMEVQGISVLVDQLSLAPSSENPSGTSSIHLRILGGYHIYHVHNPRIYWASIGRLVSHGLRLVYHRWKSLHYLVGKKGIISNALKQSNFSVSLHMRA